MTTPRALALLLALALAPLPACRRDVGPADRYRAFADAAREGKADAVWEMLSERSRAELDRRARAVAAKAPPGVIEASGRATVLGDLAAAAPRPTSVVVVRESRDAAVLSVEADGQPAREVTLVREGGVWRVVVPFDK
ncbi:MAG TPA: hypothetical protein VFL83_00745 [Anaeromyxobacter sp.]|nr:hypothetical protein [Anaeromyxobacter sp.]